VYRKILYVVFVAMCLSFMLACGGRGDFGGGSGGGTGTGTGTGTGSNTGTPKLVTITGGSTFMDGDIVVDAPAVTGANKLDMGFISVDDPNGNAYNTFTTVHQGASNSVLLIAGPGITASTQVIVTGPSPSDITLGTPTFNSGTIPALQLTISVSSTAALGARTVILKNSNNDIAAFAGGLEVIQ